MKRSGLKVSIQLIGLVLPLMHVMIGAIILGVLGFLCAIFIPVIGASALGEVINGNSQVLSKYIWVFIALAVARGILRYAEQGCNHFIAFKILAEIRNKIFIKLRTLAPAKLDSKDKGNLISILTSDIELLEVFFAHTVSPVAIAIITSIIMIVFIGRFNIMLGIIATISYIVIGAIIPFVISKKGGNTGLDYRNKFGDLNSFLLDNVRGIKEILQFDCEEERTNQLNKRTVSLELDQKKLKDLEGKTKVYTDFSILSSILVTVLVSGSLYSNNSITLTQMIVSIIAISSSFGPVVALSNLANNLLHTFASGNRVLDLLEEKPLVEDVVDGKDIDFDTVKCDNIDFSYDEEKILDKISITIPKNKIIGIQGKSGTGKSTLLKLMMRFYEAKQGEITINGSDVNKIKTAKLRKVQSYVTQDTYLFNDTIKNNIAVANEYASIEEIMEAAKKASVHETILSFPKGYDTTVGELGDSLSGGERQRIGLARSFLHNSPCMLLDEPTSNLDALNEAIILKSLDEERKNKTIVLVSHRKSSLGIADKVYNLETTRES